MTLHLDLPDDLDKFLSVRASAIGAKPEDVAISAIREALLRERYRGTWLENDPAAAAQLAPIHDAFEASGMTEDEAVELLEQEKHAMRRGE